jgi:hypothetical protein
MILDGDGSGSSIRDKGRDGEEVRECFCYRRVCVTSLASWKKPESSSILSVLNLSF